jgi:hypothetical protein
VASSWAVTGGRDAPRRDQLTQNGAIVGTPTQAVASQFTVKAIAGGKTATKQFTLKVTEPMVLTAPAAKAIKLGRQFLVSFGAKGGLGPYTWSGVGLPQVIGVNPATRGGRPTHPGAMVVTVKVTDSLGASLTAARPSRLRRSSLSRRGGCPPPAAAGTLYVTATDALGQRSTRKLKLIVRP